MGIATHIYSTNAVYVYWYFGITSEKILYSIQFSMFEAFNGENCTANKSFRDHNTIHYN